jgi:aspartyl-tRNA(Asn)/glutamyl-tRNA(Gln) amidotransferase subunit B
LVIALGISDAKMQEGSIRCDVNVSVRPVGSQTLGTRVEMKNLNSFSGVARAIDYEAARQIAMIEAGGTIEYETRRWDDIKGENVVMRSKEYAHDYRYFPDPDLLTIVVDNSRIEALRSSLPELPQAKMRRFMADYALPYDQAATLLADPDKAVLFEAVVGMGANAKSAANWMCGDVTRLLGERGHPLEDTRLTAERFYEMLNLIERGAISTAAGKIVLERIMFEDISAAAVVEAEGLGQISDADALREIVRAVVAQNPKAVEDFHGGKTNALGFLVGQCMRQTKGKGNPELLRQYVEQALGIS